MPRARQWGQDPGSVNQPPPKALLVNAPTGPAHMFIITMRFLKHRQDMSSLDISNPGHEASHPYHRQKKKTEARTVSYCKVTKQSYSPPTYFTQKQNLPVHTGAQPQRTHDITL